MATLDQFSNLVSQRTGLHLRHRERQALAAALHARSDALRLPEPEAYCRLLESDSECAEREWPELASRLTNPETYFFRDRGQMALLRDRILPELVEANRTRRTLRLWSAGCSTGEEAYSLAMLVDAVLPMRGGWDIRILGTDLNPKALERARRGVYGPWSFRMVDAALQRRYFRPTAEGWEIDPAIRQMVTLSVSNLVRDPFPDAAAGIFEMDLILCRNVFIYFGREAVAEVMRKHALTLREGGYLLTGHSECHEAHPKGLRLRKYPESFAYQRVSGELPEASDPAALAGPRVAREVHAVPGPILNVPAADGPVRPEPHPEAARLHAPPPDAARIGAGRRLPLVGTPAGQAVDAVSTRSEVIELDPLAAAPYQLLAALAEDEGDYERAKLLLKRVIYLSPSGARAYLDLGALYAREGDRTRARTMRIAALALMQGLPQDSPLEPGEEATAGEWSRHLQQLLAEGD